MRTGHSPCDDCCPTRLRISEHAGRLTIFARRTICPTIERKPGRLTERLRRLKVAVVVAVIAVLVMDVALHEKIDVTRMWHRLVPAGRIVTVEWIVSATIVPTRAVRWICAGSAQLVFVNVPLAHVMQMPVVQIISVIVVLRFGMPAGSAVSMFVRVVRCMRRH
jgi:hypothetical protein